MKRVTLDLHGFWRELRRRRVVRFALWYVALAMAGIQVADALLDAFERSELMPLVIGAIAAVFPVAMVLSWFFDITPSGVEFTASAPLAPALPSPAPAGSIAVLPFANLGGAEENEYFSDGLADEIRNELARQPGLRVAARTSSSAFKNRSEDVREIARQLNVAALLEGGVRKHQDTVRIHVQLIGAHDGFQLWSANFERQLEDIFRVQGEIAAAVTQAVAPLSARATEHAPATASFEAYNLYLRGRHHFHKRTEAALQRAVECFEQAIALDPGYALAWSGLGDACALLSTRFYGNLTLESLLAKALPAAERALALDPQLAEAHATMGLLRRLQGDLDSAEVALSRALALNPGYSMALVWRGLVLGDQGRFAEVEECDREALRVDPLSPIVNANVGFDRLRRGDHAAARERFEAAIEIDVAFPVPHYGLARVSAAEGDLDGALGHLGAAIERAPHRAYYRARRSVVLLQAGRLDEAAGALAEVCCISPENPFDEDLVVALHIARGETDTLRCIATGECARRFASAPRAQAAIAVGDHASALALYAGRPPERHRELVDLVTDDWVWRLPHVLNHAHLRHRAGDAAGSTELEALLEDFGRIAAQGIVSPLLHYWAAGAHAVLGRTDTARAELARARARGWRHDWWQQVDWNLGALGDAGA